MSAATVTDEGRDQDRGDKFSWGADVVLTQCAYCRHKADGPSPVCAAFPGRIPPEILANEFDHRRPWVDPETGRPGDTGVELGRSITFEPGRGVSPEALETLYRHLDEL